VTPWQWVPIPPLLYPIFVRSFMPMLVSYWENIEHEEISYTLVWVCASMIEGSLSSIRSPWCNLDKRSSLSFNSSFNYSIISLRTSPWSQYLFWCSSFSSFATCKTLVNYAFSSWMLWLISSNSLSLSPFFAPFPIMQSSQPSSDTTWSKNERVLYARFQLRIVLWRSICITIKEHMNSWLTMFFKQKYITYMNSNGISTWKDKRETTNLGNGVHPSWDTSMDPL